MMNNRFDFILLALKSRGYIISPLTVIVMMLAVSSIIFVPLIGSFFVPVNHWVLVGLTAGAWSLIGVYKLVRCAIAQLLFWSEHLSREQQPEQHSVRPWTDSSSD